jgi:hypothetical protein
MNMANTQGLPVPSGFTDDSIENYYRALMQPIQQDTKLGISDARSGAMERGLEGTPTEFSGVESARYYGGQRGDAAMGNLGYQLAGLKFQGNESALGRDLTRDEWEWQSKENELQRAYGRQMAQMGYDWQGNQENTRRRWEYQGQIANIGMQLGSQLVSKGISAGMGG